MSSTPKFTEEELNSLTTELFGAEIINEPEEQYTKDDELININGSIFHESVIDDLI